jgi:hypothetical protein
MNTDLEGIYQESIAAVPRAMEFEVGTSEKGWGFRECDLIDEMVKRMVGGNDENRSAAATLIERKTNEGAGWWEKSPNVDRLVRWDGWLVEAGKMTLPWVNEKARQARERAREAREEYLRIVPPEGRA